MSLCKHPKVKVKGVYYEVDAGISGLIKRIADHEIMTIDSCEHFGGDKIFICFATALDLQKLLFNLFPGGIDENDPLYDRVIPSHPEGPDDWQYLLNVAQLEDPNDANSKKVVLDASMVIPFSDYGELLKRL